jgi:signal transduction histidine kinase
VFRSTSFRLAVLYTATFALAVVALGAITFFAMRAELSKQFDTRIRAESAALVQEYLTEGLDGVVNAVHERDRTPGALDYGFEGPNGEPLAGLLRARDAPLGWSVLKLSEKGGKAEPFRVLTADLPGGYRLLVGDEEGQVEALDGVVLRSFAAALIGVILLGAIGGYALSQGVHRRLAAISGTAEAIIDGDLGRRVPMQGDDDLSRLAATLNRMLDRIGALMDSLRQVTSDVAHDLRTPLNRLRQRLERSARQAQDPADKAEIEGALDDVDAILATFAALLRISEVEAGARRAAFRRLDLRALARAVAEDFAPAAEDTGHRLEFEDGPPVWIEGDAELLTQMTVNLVENALRHTPAGCVVRLAADEAAGRPVLTVSDNGPGVPAAERARLFDRFYRLERSRSTPGSGLGLALVQAVARLHRGEASLTGAKPGLKAQVVFPATS